MTNDSASTDILVALLAACRANGGSPALTRGRVTLSYTELLQRVSSTAAGLTSMGFFPGDRVLFSVRPGIDGIVLALGIIGAGGTVVFADPGAGEAMFRARAALAAPGWVAAESLLYFASSRPLRGIARRRGIELPGYSSVVPEARHLYAGRRLPGVPRTATSIRDLVDAPEAPLEPRVRADHEALIIFTSGTTADPKAVVHSRASLGTGLAGFAERTGLAPGDRVLTDQLMIGIPALIAGAHWTLPSPGIDPGAKPSNYLTALPATDVLFMVPAGLDALLRLLDADPSRAPRLATLLIGGAPVLRPLLERARARFPQARILAIYGMTEILPVAIAEASEKLAFTGSGDFVGELVPAVEATIVEGELVLAGRGLALGYLGHGPLTYLGTGDLARLDGDRLVLIGRAKDMFIRGSTNVYPGLYEPVIAGLPGLAAVAMVGVPNEIGDDRIVLVIVPATDAPAALSADHPLIPAVAAALPGLIDAAVLPDRILAIGALPLSGRSGKLDRAALVTAVRELLP
ncbi:class I adenylate-forming enzyme family protein [Lacisediminihabitans changchengi]|uniref:Acyl--CoA ligase n=1 Tax=Lacisediminihabitans changchengi TaxID=2787634 RepID=A0A934SKE5_9MICO|nr:class I adenylate-forming enzyme family protein [Lacisediminihabitans changchengi]MBK4347203.1 acyl--CoA ligase [Lacisediminihabitans changchengi]